MALTPVDPAEVATIVTTLEMRTRPRPRPMPNAPLGLVAWADPDPAKYRALFARVGAPWLWFSRLVMRDDMLTAIIHDPAVSVFAVVDRAGIEVGLLELDHRRPGECEIAYFGLIPELAGRGHGRWLMAQALMRAWTASVERVWVHTCTLDHPSALNFYRRQGFVAIGRAVETFADPRLLGLLPEGAAPQIPLIRPVG
ncbi:GNAT family N-acetyltransferase [Sphingomonas sp. Leaf21]|uniref:GNAT family N-acetyltransferase n=1 Tax=Sphingomonas sp. Leaf21 TaxID=2876550 RepID=UPI001E430B00|nr:GNAT family N-acetyltransferase [Sphingomonas sp. Leaf21]